jgi:hypothetical protein
MFKYLESFIQFCIASRKVPVWPGRGLRTWKIPFHKASTLGDEISMKSQDA